MAEIEDHPLYKLLIRAAPEDENGVKRIRTLAQKIGMSRYGVYKWIKTERIRPVRARQVVEASEGRVKLSEFDPWIYNI
ncbi:MAG: hypothetical protein GVY29_07790 [Spirochaetes bacterium]|nr:hypothetical protein [Spirochaetota bacterium]